MHIKNRIITSEYVSYGHPDKLADQIADQILFDISLVDKDVRAGIEVIVKDNIVVLGGEISTTVENFNYDASVKHVFSDVAYPKGHHLSPEDIKVINLIGKQSPEISAMVDKTDGEIGAGDQGFCVGYASNETSSYLPLGHYIAQLICLRVCVLCGRKWGADGYKQMVFGPDVKTQVVVSYNETGDASIDHILVSAMHPDGGLTELRDKVTDMIRTNRGVFMHIDIHNAYIKDKNVKIDVNPYGEWTVGGPISDCGSTGRKVVVDQFGGYCNVGGGAFSGKDMTKVDRSGAYMARFIAKNIVGAGICDEAKVTLSYIIGQSQPCALDIELSDNAELVPKIREWLYSNVDMSPSGIINRFTENGRINLMYPLFSRFGHYGTESFRPWEHLDLVDGLGKLL